MSIFHEQALQKAEDIYNTVELTEDQQACVESLSKVMCTGIPMDELSMRGFMLQVCNSWQEENNMNICDIQHLEVSKKLSYAKEIFGKFHNSLTQVLCDPTDEPKLVSGIIKGLETYKKKIARR